MEHQQLSCQPILSQKPRGADCKLPASTKFSDQEITESLMGDSVVRQPPKKFIDFIHVFTTKTQFGFKKRFIHIDIFGVHLFIFFTFVHVGKSRCVCLPSHEHAQSVRPHMCECGLCTKRNAFSSAFSLFCTISLLFDRDGDQTGKNDRKKCELRF